MKHQRGLVKTTSYGSRNMPEHVQALVNIESKINHAYNTLQSHARKNFNIQAFARETQNMILLLAELRYLINECKKAQRAQGRSGRAKRAA